MLTQRTNWHHSPLPPVGAVVRLRGPRGPRAVVEAYPLNDNVGPWSVGVHTAHVRRLHDGRRLRLAWHHLHTED